ncbi:MAG: hypothetical protein AUJ85_07365 [Elusimicrobia bacterium CG1_02_37_114]|nr:MAG: hypothetical protein AUJ85_07365 [Elusimicrobia bacterium CG1_02_37_114]PIV53900.1 MAG: hypothetical protein COS17_01450 [Elusimicrobia bacterium CG02_land_8_20_14_3_00_37_13]PIZ13118.1 MAG: hypothetical protein COY53_06615 [Elusimicrobia bacterium CG_4_10_14_0_8_um_filter_37_32]
MELLIVILNKVELLNDLLSIFIEAGITQSTVFESEGMAHLLAYDVPVFAGLREIVGEKKSHNKTILALVNDRSMLDELKKLSKEIQLDFTKPGTGIMFTLPVNYVIKPEKDRPE